MGWWRLQLTALLTVRQMLSQPSGVDLLLDNGVGTFNSTKGQGKRRLQVVLEWTGGKNSAIWWWHGSDLQKLLWALIFRVCKSPGAPEGQAGYAAEMCCAAEQTSLPHWTARPFFPPFYGSTVTKHPCASPLSKVVLHLPEEQQKSMTSVQSRHTQPPAVYSACFSPSPADSFLNCAACICNINNSAISEWPCAKPVGMEAAGGPREGWHGPHACVFSQVWTSSLPPLYTFHLPSLALPAAAPDSVYFLNTEVFPLLFLKRQQRQIIVNPLKFSI